MGNNIELLSLNCAACSAALENFQDQSECKCEFCNNVTKILRPIKVNANTIKFAEGDASKFKNYILIMEKSMIAGNHQEAYDYCNKSLEIDPNSAALWENKAICSFWLRAKENIIDSEAKEILTYLNAAKQSDPNSSTYNDTARSIANNLYFAVYYRYLLVIPDADFDGTNFSGYSGHTTKRIVSYINIMNLCFDISPAKMYLETAVIEINGSGKMIWIGFDKNKNRVNHAWCASYSIDALKTREKHISKIKKIDPSYIAPDFAEINTPFVIPRWGLILFLIFSIGVGCVLALALLQ